MPTQMTSNTATLSSRRAFINNVGKAATAFTILPRFILGGQGYTPPSDKINLAVIGTGGQGLQNIKSLLPHNDVQIIAICDVMVEADYGQWYYGGSAGRKPAKALIDAHYARHRTSAEYKTCAVYVDFRKMLDHEPAIDAVLIATPDHTHAITAMAAIQRGKAVFCEKPLARTIFETRRIVEAAREAGVATQMGNQGHSGEGIRLTVEWLRDDAIGTVREVHAWCSHVNTAGCTPAKPTDKHEVPEGMDWDLWIGPAAHRPYHPDYAPFTWRQWWDFGTGLIGDMGCHHIDPAFWALDLGHPEWVEARAAFGTPEKRPFASLVHYHFPARGDRPPVKLVWYGGLMPPRPEELEPGRELTGGGNGILFIGDKGKIMCPGWGGNPRLIPETKMRAYQRPPKHLPRSNGHHRDWLDAFKGGPPASASFEYGGPLTELVLLGVVAIRTGEKLYWDGPQMKVTNFSDAESFIHPKYHNGWTL